MQKKAALAKVMSAGVATITRTELIELVMEEMTGDLDVEIKVLQAKRDVLDKPLTLDEVKHLIGDKPVFQLNVGDNGGSSISLDYDRDIKVSPKDGILGERIKQTLSLEKQIYKLQIQRSNIETNKKQFKAQVTKRILEGSAEGRSVLEQLSALKAQMKSQLK